MSPPSRGGSVNTCGAFRGSGSSFRPGRSLRRWERPNILSCLDAPSFRGLHVDVFVTAPVIDHRRLALAANGEDLNVLASDGALGGRLDDDVGDDVLVAAQFQAAAAFACQRRQ